VVVGILIYDYLHLLDIQFFIFNFFEKSFGFVEIIYLSLQPLLEGIESLEC
jgi:hypothetical protein